MRPLLSFLLITTLLSTWPEPVQGVPEPMPTPAALQQLHEAGDHKAFLEKLARVLALRGDAAKPYDLGKLNLLKAESCVQLRQSEQAAFALKEVLNASTLNAAETAAARGLQLLLSRSPTMVYKPKLAGAAAVSLQDVTDRPAAYAALFADLRAEFDARLKAVRSAKTLQPVIVAAQDLRDMAVVETLATQSDAISRRTGAELSALSGDLIARALNDLDQRIAAINEKANELTLDRPAEQVREKAREERRLLKDRDQDITRQGDPLPPQNWTYRKAGLNSVDHKYLQNAIDTSDTVIRTCSSLASLLPDQADTYRKIITAAQRTANQASAVLTTDYNEKVVRQEPPGTSAPGENRQISDDSKLKFKGD